MSLHHRAIALAAKTSPPVATTAIIARPRIRALAADFAGNTLVLMTAPAGFGKTVALSQCFQAIIDNGGHATWMSVDVFDNEPARFFENLIVGFRNIRPGFGNDILAGLAQGPDSDLPFVLTGFLNECLVIEGQVVVFIDDFHEIDDPRVLQGVDYVLRYLPSNITMVLAGRGAPHLHVSRLRAQRRLLELDWRELTFSDAEAEALFADIHKLDISREHRNTLFRRAEGWAAGLQLAALALARSERAEQYVQTFSGASTHIADFLIEDVFTKLTEPERLFLAQTSVASVLTASLCDALTGRSNGQQMLEWCEKNNLFIFRLDEIRNWYRYHHLFREFLQRILASDSPAAPIDLALRASRWFEEHGDDGEAIRYAVAAKDYRRATRLLTAFGRSLLAHGELRELKRRIAMVPSVDADRHPQIYVLHAWCLAFMGELNHARLLLQRAHQREDEWHIEEPSSLFLESRVLEAAIGVIEGDAPATVDVDWELPSRIARDELVIRAFSHIVLSHAARARNCLAIASAHVTQAMTLAERANSPFMSLIARYNWGAVNTLNGKLGIAGNTLSASLRYADRHGWSHNMGTAFIRVQLASVLREGDFAAAALRQLDAAIAILSDSEAFGFLGLALTERALTAFALGTGDDGLNDIEQAHSLCRERELPKVEFRAALAQAEYLLDHAEHSRCAALLDDVVAEHGDAGWLRGAGASEDCECFLFQYLRFRLALDANDDVINAAAAAAAAASEAGRAYSAARLLALRAAALYPELPDAAATELDRALALVKGEPVVRAFQPIASGTPDLIDRLPHAHRPKSLTEVAPGTGHGQTNGRAPTDRSAEAFSQRELQILTLVSRGLRNRDIAQKLFITEHTVKWHLGKLYAKLDAASRTQAVANARGDGIID